MLERAGGRRDDVSPDLVGHRRRPVHTVLGVLVAVLFVAVELLVVRSYHHAASTSASLLHATDVTTTLANVSREAQLIQAEVLTLRSEDDFDAITLRRALLDRQVRIVDVSQDPELSAGIERLGITLAAIDSELAALEAHPLEPEAARQRLRPLFAALELQTKQLFDSQEHRLYGALDVDVRSSARDQLLLVGLGGFVLLLGIILTYLLRRSIRADFGRAHEALKMQIVEREALQLELAHQAFHDPLTGLPNRAFFVEEAARALARARRRPDATLAMLYLDLDDFKAVNDTLGHAAGDELLRVMAERMGACLRETDTVARLGGDEFGIILEGDGGPQDIANVAARLVESASRPIDVLGRQVEVGASVGVALAKPDSDVGHLMQSADLAMYEAKNAGKGAWVLFDPRMRGKAEERRQLEHDLGVAVTDGQLICHYQPVVNLATGEIDSFEALVRWRHPSGTLLEPAAFIDVAEESGIILALGDVVLDQACRQGVEWSALPGGSNLSVCVNVSGRQLQEPGFAGRLQQTLERTGMDPSRIIVEITERVMMQETDATVRVLGELRTLGVRVAIDDFGIGYSSLSYLRFLPIDILKIDRSFVQAADQGRLIAESIVRLAETLGLTAVAEGIEEDEQLSWLRSLGCDLGQGYLFARPLPAEEATRMIGHRWPMPDDSSVLVDVR